MSFMETRGDQRVAQYPTHLDTTASWRTRAAQIDPLLAQCFSVIARCGCFMQASRRLNIKATRLRKHLAQLEKQLRCSLFSPSENGLVLSRDGLQLHKQLTALAHERDLPVLEQPVVRLAVAETILHDILGRDLVALLRRNASARLDIITLDSELSLQAVSADVVVSARQRRDRVLPSTSPDAWRGSTIYRTSPNAIHESPRGRPVSMTWPISCWCNGSMIDRSTVFGPGTTWSTSAWPGSCSRIPIH